jgi:hypothetical protein
MPMTRTYTGSCHCKAVRYEVDADLTEGTNRCNCTYCGKSRNWSLSTKPAHFRLLTPESTLGAYRVGGENRHEFCARCGVRTFSRGNIPEIGGEFVTVQVSTLDEVPVDELLSGPIRYLDGLHDNWWTPPAEIRHL